MAYMLSVKIRNFNHSSFNHLSLIPIGLETWDAPKYRTAQLRRQRAFLPLFLL